MVVGDLATQSNNSLIEDQSFRSVLTASTARVYGTRSIAARASEPPLLIPSRRGADHPRRAPPSGAYPRGRGPKLEPRAARHPAV
jgi:hypothetical protein